MTNPCNDPALDIVNVFLTAMREHFDPDSTCPPDGGGTKDVRFFAGDDGRPAELTPMAGGRKCAPLAWVRVDHRHRSTVSSFPDPFRGNVASCATGLFSVLMIEVGIGRCAAVYDAPNWDKLDDEATISLDDSWRLDRVLCVAAGRLKSKSRAVATDSVAAAGPGGGLVAWTGVAYVQL